MQRTEKEIEMMREDYFKITQIEFKKRYNISTTTMIELFGYKHSNRACGMKSEEERIERMERIIELSKEREQKVKNSRENEINEIMEKYQVSRKEVVKLNIDYALSEILNAGYIENGKLKCKDLVKIYR